MVKSGFEWIKRHFTSGESFWQFQTKSLCNHAKLEIGLWPQCEGFKWWTGTSCGELPVETVHWKVFIISSNLLLARFDWWWSAPCLTVRCQFMFTAQIYFISLVSFASMVALLKPFMLNKSWGLLQKIYIDWFIPQDKIIL